MSATAERARTILEWLLFAAIMRSTIQPGQRFGRLVPLLQERNHAGKMEWRCACDCGGSSLTAATALRSGRAKSCGCLREENRSKIRTEGLNKPARSYPEYGVYNSMVERCSNPNNAAFYRYGGRGIRVCDRWLEGFKNFIADMGERPAGCSIERIDNDGDYEPGNCRWATMYEQMANTSRSIKLTFRGKTQSVLDWCEELGLKPFTVYSRLNTFGWSTERALTTPCIGYGYWKATRATAGT